MSMLVCESINSSGSDGDGLLGVLYSCVICGDVGVVFCVVFFFLLIVNI